MQNLPILQSAWTYKNHDKEINVIILHKHILYKGSLNAFERYSVIITERRCQNTRQTLTFPLWWSTNKVSFTISVNGANVIFFLGSPTAWNHMDWDQVTAVVKNFYMTIGSIKSFYLQCYEIFIHEVSINAKIVRYAEVFFILYTLFAIVPPKSSP